MLAIYPILELGKPLCFSAFGRVLYSKEIETLHNVTSFSKFSHRHFSTNITKLSEQLSLTPFSNYIVNE